MEMSLKRLTGSGSCVIDVLIFNKDTTSPPTHKNKKYFKLLLQKAKNLRKGGGGLNIFATLCRQYRTRKAALTKIIIIIILKS